MSILRMVRGDRRIFDLTLTDEDGPLDLTDLDLTFTAKRHLLDPDDEAVLTLTNNDGIIVDDDPSTGVAVLTIAAEDTEGLADATRLFWDIQVDDGIGGIKTPLSGTLVISADVTQTASMTS